jgi:DNA (cytosine-5)-methyltransferase 1
MGHLPLLPMISLFTGAGGLDLGLEKAGFTTMVAVEKDSSARRTLERNRRHFRRPTLEVLEDITAITPDQVLLKAGLACREAALVAGGPPCQSFSTAGRRGSFGDPRGGLFRNFAEVVRVAQPRFFLMENVRGLLSAAITHRPLAERGPDFPPLTPDEEQGSAFRVIRDVFQNQLKYQVVVGLANSADYGVPQERLRVLILGSRDAEFESETLAEIVLPTHLGRHQTLHDAIATVEGPQEYLKYSTARAEVMAAIPAGRNWRWLRDNPNYGPSVTESLMGGAWAAEGGKVGFFRRLAWDKPSPTLPTSPIQKSTSLCHPIENRPLSIQEYAAIQQFPEDYSFAGSLSQRYKQVGNAVPRGLGEAVGAALLGIIRRSGSITSSPTCD